MVFNSLELLQLAREGDSAAKGQLLDHFRPYLNVIAQRMLNERVRGRLDPTDIVQVTFLEASRDFPAFRGENIDSLLAWLRNILRNNVQTAHQEHLLTQKRSARLERKLTFSQDASGSAFGLEHIIPSEASTPSQRMMKDEAAAQLASMLENIPETQRNAIRLRYLEGYSVRDIAAMMEKTEMAVAGLLKRGLQTLRGSKG